MKVRQGFVSNSSSSSFIICGWRGPLSEEIIEKLEKHYSVEYKEDEDYPSDALNNFISQCGLDIGEDSDGEVTTWGSYYKGSYNDSVELLRLEDMKEIMNAMYELGLELKIGLPNFFLVGV